MLEAWLLFNEAAIRQAAGNPNGRQQLNLPTLMECERLPKPKEILHDALRNATGLTGRRRQKFDPHVASHRLAESIRDFSPLRALSAFKYLETQLTHHIQSQQWGT
jgi:hypothetical protein